MTECNGCGGCCHLFTMVYTPTDIENLDRLGRIDPDEAAFYRQHLTPMPRKEARQLVKHWAGPFSAFFIEGRLVTAWAQYYVCDLFDQATGRCLDYEHRPDPCLNYPWYGDPPDPDKVIPPECSYNANLGRPVAAPTVRRRHGGEP